MGAPTHRMSHTREWNSLATALSRCGNANDPDYHSYGGRGIRVCDRWQDDHATFFQDMGSRPAGKTLDRIDVNGDYSPANCRWETPRNQARGRRDAIVLSVNGDEKLMVEWADESGMPTDLINRRLRNGWPAWDAVNRKKQKPGPPKSGVPGRVSRMWSGVRDVDSHPAVRRRG